MRLRAVPFRGTTGERGARSAREVEVARALDAHGLATAELRLLASAGGVPEGLGERLARALPPLGGAFPAFAAWLGARVDLLGAGECSPLADLDQIDEIDEIDDSSQPEAAPTAEAEAAEEAAWIAALIASGAVAAVEPRPRAATPFVHRHRALDRNGRPLVVRRVAPALAEASERDRPALALVAERLAPALPRGTAERLVDDFRADLERRLEGEGGGGVARALDALAGTTPQPGLRVARAVASPPAIAPGLVVVEAFADACAPATLRPATRDALARRLARFVLSELFAGRLALDLEVAVTADGALAISALTTVAVPSAARASLREAIEATALHDPERAAAALLRELAATPEAPPDAARDFAKRLRQMVPRHEPSLSSAGESLAEHLLAAAPLARRAGLTPSPALADLWRALYATARAARRISPSRDPLRDPLREAVEDLRWQGGFDQMRQLADPERMGAALETYLSAMAALPQRLERALDAAANARAEAPRDDERASRNDATAAIAIGLAMLAVAIAGGGLPLGGAPAAATPAAIPEPWSAVAFLALGVWLLRILWSRR